MKNPVEAGEFPPCIQVTTEEVNAIRGMRSYRLPSDVKADEDEAKKLTLPPVVVDVPTKERLLARDEQILMVLGRVSGWCRAYHERIGYKEPQAAATQAPAPAPTQAPPSTEQKK